MFYRLKAEYDGTEYPWPTDSNPKRTIQIFADDILTPSNDKPGTMMKHTGLGCFGIEIPAEHMNAWSGWPRMSLNGYAYGSYEEPKLISQ